MKSFLLFLLCFICCAPLLSAANNTTSVQRTLARLGFYHDAIDGKMGSATNAAIRRFQVANHLHPTGTLTPDTAAALGLPASAASTKNRTPFHPTPARSYASTDPKMLADLFVGGPLLAASPEIQVATVKKAQYNLKLLGYYRGPINGLPSGNLKTALQAYQRDSKFKRTGRLDKITLMGLDILPGVYHPGE